ncbi:hypothetical protein CMV_022179 [Castanea mollissima]|uniref:Uncharacterized protein n=1 Tax=Castanea mollissima TaxID=60419 RepID=A0A8J4QWT7_9ROSI|nr:hypothetical protein CMV_022179 [Castanea mollissima]
MTSDCSGIQGEGGGVATEAMIVEGRSEEQVSETVTCLHLLFGFVSFTSKPKATELHRKIVRQNQSLL